MEKYIIKAEEKGGIMRIELTSDAENNVNFLMQVDRTPSEIVSFLKKEVHVQDFTHIMDQLYPNEDLKERLVEGLVKHGEENRSSVMKKVQNWLSNKNVPQSREVLYQICYILNFTELEASLLLGACSDTGIHYRDYSELIYAYGLRMKIDYLEIVKLKEEIEKKLELKEIHNNDSDIKVFTKTIYDEFLEVNSIDDLYEFLENHKEELGEYHNTAYLKFRELIDNLKKPVSREDEGEYSVNDIMDYYLRMNTPNNKKTSGYSILQKTIKKYWPNSTMITNIYLRKEDVSRKVLLLLYLVTEMMDEIVCDDETYYLWEEEEDVDLLLEERFYRMNLLLNDYGMNRLNPCNPFDYIVLYAMKVDEEGGMSEKVSEIMAQIFESV